MMEALLLHTQRMDTMALIKYIPLTAILSLNYFLLALQSNNVLIVFTLQVLRTDTLV
jgi:hypothetical protein